MKEIWFLNKDKKLFNIFFKDRVFVGGTTSWVPKKIFQQRCLPPYIKAIVVVRPWYQISPPPPPQF